MAGNDSIDPRQEHLDSRYGDMELRLVEEPTDSGNGMTPREARSFLRGLHPVARVRHTLRDLAKKAGKST